MFGHPTRGRRALRLDQTLALASFDVGCALYTQCVKQICSVTTVAIRLASTVGLPRRSFQGFTSIRQSEAVSQKPTMDAFLPSVWICSAPSPMSRYSRM